MVMMNSCASSGKAALVDSYLLVNKYLCDGYQHCLYGDDEQLCYFRKGQALVDSNLLINNTFVMGTSIVPMVMMNSCASSGKGKHW